MPIALDILNEICDRLGWPQIESLEEATLPKETRKLLRLLNRVLETLSGMEDWPMLREDGTLQLVADETSDLTSGSEQYVTATQNSDEVTLANATLNAAYEGRAIKFSNCEYVFRIEEVTSATTLKLNRAWFQASITAADEVTFTIAMDRYVLPTNFDRPIDDFDSFLSPYGINPISPEDFAERRRRRQNTIEVGEPEVYTIYGLNDAQTAQIIHFDPFPDDIRILNFPYIKIHPTIDSDNDKILFPRRLIEVIVDMMVQLAYRDYEDDDRMQVALVEMITKYNNVAGKKTVTQNRKTLQPDGRTRMATYRGYRAMGGNVDWGDSFDRAGNVGFF